MSNNWESKVKSQNAEVETAGLTFDRLYGLSLLHSHFLLLPYFLTLLWCVLGIFMSSLYLATVRRVTWIPCDCRMRVICSSVKGLDGSSSSISFFTRRFRISSDVFPPSGPFTLSLKKWRSS